MLVLSRKEGQEIVLGDNVVVRVIRTQGNRVQIGIQAPADVRVARGELLKPPAPQESPPAEYPKFVRAG